MHNPNFSSGPCGKRPGWSFDSLKDAPLGRSHRSALSRQKLKKAIYESKKLLRVPKDYLLGIFPGSDTGAFEAAMWTLLGPRPVTVLVWESFSAGWANDIRKELKLNPTVLEAPYGKIPDLKKVDWGSDVVFVANGTTSGVKIPDWDWILREREGLSLCDATSAVFAMDIDWSRVDVLTYSWQKCLGGEAGHGVLILSPKAIERIESYDPPWPMPKIFRMKKGASVNRSIFEGDTINTPSMLCVEDYLDVIKWAGDIGLEGLIDRSKSNLNVIEEWVEKTDWIDFLAESREIRSRTSVCLMITSDKFKSFSEEDRAGFVKSIAGKMSKDNIAHDVSSYKNAPAGFRFWCGPTIEPSDIKTAIEALERLYYEETSQL